LDYSSFKERPEKRISGVPVADCSSSDGLVELISIKEEHPSVFEINRGGSSVEQEARN
jgi:hypothetical protein